MTTPAPHLPQVPGPVPDLHDLLWDRYVRALDIKQRFHVIRPFADELKRVSRGKPFRFRNGIVWRAMLDVRDKLVIDLCSLTVEMRHGMKPIDPKAEQEYRGGFKRKRGLFRELRDHHLVRFTRSYVPHSDDDEYEVERYTDRKAETFARLFPNCTADSPSACDMEDLCERFRLHMVPLKDDRNKNRAHALEGDAGTVKMLWVPELADCFDCIENLLGDLSELGGGSMFCGDNMNDADCDKTAADIVDMIMLGNIDDVRQLTAKRTRDALYARLHEIDDNARDSKHEKLHFNDRQWTETFEDIVAFYAAGGVRAVDPA